MYSWARWIGFRVWNPTTLRPPMIEGGRQEPRLGLPFSVTLEDLLDLEDGERILAVVGDECNRVAPADPLHVVVRERKGHRDGPRDPVRKVHRLQDRAVLGLALEPRERREGEYRREHLEVGQL